MDTKEIKLKYPIPIPQEGGGTIQCSILTLSRLKAKHLKLLPKGFLASKGEIEPEELMPLIAGLSNIPESAIDEIDVIEDLPLISEALESFLGESQKIGEKSSG